VWVIYSLYKYALAYTHSKLQIISILTNTTHTLTNCEFYSNNVLILTKVWTNQLMSFLVEKVNLTCKHSAYTHIFTGTNYICRLGCTCIYKRQEILERNHLPTSRTLFNKLKVILHRVIQCLSQYKHKILHTAIYKNLVRQTMILIKLVDISTFCYYTKIYLPMSVFPDFF
jgi:hypothetical protein